MFRFLDWLVAHLIGAGFVWWLVSPKTTATTAAICVGAACAGAWGWYAVQRARRRRKEDMPRKETLSPGPSGEPPPSHPMDAGRR